MHLRIRQGYDKTAADTWREHCAEITTRAEAAERRVAELERDLDAAIKSNGIVL
jgi:hypothetical protein